MLYDKTGTPPPVGSQLESIFLIITKRRQEAEYLRVRAMIEATLAPHAEDNKLMEAFEDYSNAMFPYMKQEKKKKSEEDKQKLEQMSQYAFKVKKLNQPGKDKAFHSRMKRSAKAIERSEKLRKEYKHHRI